MVMEWLLAVMEDVVARAVTLEDDGRFESSRVSSSVRGSSSLLLPLMAGCNGALQTRGEEGGAKSSTRPWRNGGGLLAYATASCLGWFKSNDGERDELNCGAERILRAGHASSGWRGRLAAKRGEDRRIGFPPAAERSTSGFPPTNKTYMCAAYRYRYNKVARSTDTGKYCLFSLDLQQTFQGKNGRPPKIFCLCNLKNFHSL